MQRTLVLASLALLAAPLVACGGNGDDALAERVKDTAENRADQMEVMAENLQDQAERTRDVAADRAAAIDAADLNAEAMTEQQKAEIAANTAAAVQ